MRHSLAGAPGPLVPVHHGPDHVLLPLLQVSELVAIHLVPIVVFLIVEKCLFMAMSLSKLANERFKEREERIYFFSELQIFWCVYDENKMCPVLVSVLERNKTNRMWRCIYRQSLT